MRIISLPNTLKGWGVEITYRVWGVIEREMESTILRHKRILKEVCN